MNDFERLLHGVLDGTNNFWDARYIGRACYAPITEDLRIKAEFQSTLAASQYNALKLTAISNKNGVIDTLTLYFSDFFPEANKLKAFDIPQEEKTKIIEYLLDNRFVNDERFAKSFVRGKVNQSGWGVNKIRFHLIQKGIDKEVIDEALGQTDEEVYRQRLIDILKTKSKTIKAANDFEKKRKLAAYAMQKGFEGVLVWEVLKSLD